MGAESLQRLEKGSDKLLQEKSLQHNYTATLGGEAVAGKPHHSSAFPWVPTSPLAGTWPLLSLHLLLGGIPTSRSSPAWFLNPEVKARDQRSCWRVPEWLKKARLAQRPRQQRKQNKRQNIHTANLYNVIVTKVIVPHPTSY